MEPFRPIIKPTLCPKCKQPLLDMHPQQAIPNANDIGYRKCHTICPTETHDEWGNPRQLELPFTEEEGK